MGRTKEKSDKETIDKDETKVKRTDELDRALQMLCNEAVNCGNNGIRR